MERYESLGLVGEGSYGTVLKCRHRDSGRLVAIKKFMDSDDDKTVKKIALREIKLLRQLRHGNLVNLLEVWKRRRRWYLVFQFVERTLLEDLEQNPNGLDLNTGRQYLYQILRAAAFCHQQNIIHRDIKPENILISQEGIVKLCDFGFARTVASPAEGGVYTDYVATRWYRAPELLVGDLKYGKPVDVWAIGCLLVEMLTGQPLFPGDSDLDQIYHIVRCFGNLTAHHQELFHRNPAFSGVKVPECYGRVPLQQRFPKVTPTALDMAQSCLQMDPEGRAQCSELLEHPLFTQDSFHRFLNELNIKIQKDLRENSVLPKITKTPRREKGEGNEKNQRGKEKKQLEDVDEKFNKEKEKKNTKEEEKIEKTKGKQPSKLSKTIRNTSDLLIPTKQSKMVAGVKVADKAARAPVKSKPGKAAAAEISKAGKTLSSPSSDGTRPIKVLKNNNTPAAKSKHGKAASPEPRDHIKSTKSTKDINPTGLHSSGSETTVSSKAEKTLMEICRSSKSLLNKECGSSSSRASLESKVKQTDSSLALQPSSNDHSTLFVPFLMKPHKTSEYQTDQLIRDPTQQYLKSFTDAGPGCSSSALPEGTSTPKLSKTALTSVAKATNGVTCVSNKTTQKVREPTEVSITTKIQQDASYEVIREDCGRLNFRPAAKTADNHIAVSRASGRDHREDPQPSEPSNIQQASFKYKITPESRPSSDSILSGIPKTIKVSDKENRQDLALSVTTSATTKVLVNQSSKVSGSSSTRQKNSCSEEKLPLSKSLVGSLSNHSMSSAIVTVRTQRPSCLTEARKTNDKPARNDTTRSPEAPDQRASKRSFVLHDTDTADLNEFDISAPHSSPPPPPPPPSSTPLLLHPSSTSLIPTFSVSNADGPTASDHLTLGAGFHPGSHSLRCIDKPRHHGGIYSRLAQQSVSGHITVQVSDKSLICEGSFLSDRCNTGKGGGVAVAKKKSNVHFPDLRSSMLPELRGTHGKHNKGVANDQRKDKPPVPSTCPAEPQQIGHNSTNGHHTHSKHTS